MMTRTSLFDLEPCSDEFDSGCPHLATFAALRRAINETSSLVIVTGDVGCMSLDIKMGDPVIETMTCMGASPGVAAGLKIAMPNARVVSVIGDSSFFHSGIQGVLNNIEQRIPVITLILDNMITAQSGFQPDAGSVQARRLKKPGSAMMDEVLRAMGSNVLTVDSFDPGLVEVLSDALKKDQSLVIVSRGKCPIAEKVGAYKSATSV
jgi:indolepyruvate ferredoxin oxidoreductase alpha subunit